MPQKVGDKLGPYEILAPIGKSGMGRCIAHEQRLRRDVTIKVSNDRFYRALYGSRIAYTGRAEGGLTQWSTRRRDHLGSTFLPDTTLLDRRRSTRARRLPSPS